VERQQAGPGGLNQIEGCRLRLEASGAWYGDTLDRPEVLNSFDRAMAAELRAALEVAAAKAAAPFGGLKPLPVNKPHE